MILLIGIESSKSFHSPYNKLSSMIWIPFAFLMYSVSVLSSIPFPCSPSLVNTAIPASVSANKFNATPCVHLKGPSERRLRFSIPLHRPTSREVIRKSKSAPLLSGSGLYRLISNRESAFLQTLCRFVLRNYPGWEFRRFSPIQRGHRWILQGSRIGSNKRRLRLWLWLWDRTKPEFGTL